MENSQALIIGMAALIGLAVGSFLNLVIARVPARESVLAPLLRCARCSSGLINRHNIPFLKCGKLRWRHCSRLGPISGRDVIVIAVTALVFAGLTAHALITSTLGLLPLLLVSCAILIALFVIDLDHSRLPNALTYLMYPVAVVGLFIDGLVTGNWAIGSALIGAGIWLLALGGIWVLSGGRAMGMGDVKLAPALGLILGWVGVGSSVVGLLSAWLMGGFVAMGLLLSRRARKGTAIAFGPFLIGGFAIGLLFGEAIADSYVGTLGL